MTKAWWALRGSAVVAVVAVSLGGCAAQAGPEEPALERESIGTVSSPLVAFDPCHPDWQLPTSARRALTVEDPTGAFNAFEDRLEKGRARWIGNFELPKPYRAVVRVDHYLAGTKKDPRSGLWFLASIPVESRDAVAAVDDFSRISPVLSRVLGYCDGAGHYRSNDGSGPPVDFPVKQVIVEYDPRCVCYEVPTTGVSTWVNWGTYGGIPSP